MARREDRLRAGFPLVAPLWVFATEDARLFKRILRFFFRTEPLVSAGDFDELFVDELFVFLFAFTFAKRLSPRQKRRDPSLPDEIPGGRLRRRPRSIVVSSERTEIDKVYGCCGLYRPGTSDPRCFPTDNR